MDASFTVFQVRQEQYQDLLREAVRERLIRRAALEVHQSLLLIGYEKASDRVRGLVCQVAPLRGARICSLPAA